MTIRIGGERRWAAAEDAGLFRDGLGAVPPSGLPEVFTADVPDAMERLVRRFARTHGPFETDQLRDRYGVDFSPVLKALETSGDLVRGELRPGGTQREWCDPEVLRRLRRASLAALRKEIEPADQRALARFLPNWQGVDRHPPAGAGPDRLREALIGLQGLALPAEVWERDVLPRRVGAYSPSWMDMLCAAGELVWIGAGPLGRRSGKVALYFREDVRLLGPPPPPKEAPSGRAQDAIRERLATGACFFTDLLADIAGIPSEELQEALWDLVWAGEVTNDAYAPLRSPRLSAPWSQQARADRRRRFSARRSGSQPQVQGRWSLVSTLFTAPEDPTARRRTQAELLLERYGIVTREQVLAEGIPGGFSSLYDSLSALETVGVARRGYFIEGLGGAQFALPGAVERLRAQRDDDTAPPIVLAATDPAQPYGAVLEVAAARRPDAGARGRRLPRAGRRGARDLRRARRQGPADPGRGQRPAAGRRRRRPRRRRPPRPHQAPRDRARRRRAGRRLRVGGRAARARLPRRPAQAHPLRVIAALLARGRARSEVPSADPGYLFARSLARAGPRPAGSAAERRAHARVEKRFKAAGLRIGHDRFRVPGHGRSRNVVGIYDTPADCLVVLTAHTDSVPPAPGADDNASGVGTLVALAPRLATIRPACDVWLIATGAEERPYTGQADHLGARAAVPRVKRRAKDLRFVLSLDEVGRGTTFHLRSAANRARVEGKIVKRRPRRGPVDQGRRERQLRPPRVHARRPARRQARRARRAVPPHRLRHTRPPRAKSLQASPRDRRAAPRLTACPRATRSTTPRTGSGRCSKATSRTRSRRCTRASAATAGPSACRARRSAASTPTASTSSSASPTTSRSTRTCA